MVILPTQAVPVHRRMLWSAVAKTAVSCCTLRQSLRPLQQPLRGALVPGATSSIVYRFAGRDAVLLSLSGHWTSSTLIRSCTLMLWARMNCLQVGCPFHSWQGQNAAEYQLGAGVRLMVTRESLAESCRLAKPPTAERMRHTTDMEDNGHNGVVAASWNKLWHILSRQWRRLQMPSRQFDESLLPARTQQ